MNVLPLMQTVTKFSQFSSLPDLSPAEIQQSTDWKTSYAEYLVCHLCFARLLSDLLHSHRNGSPTDGQSPTSA